MRRLLVAFLVLASLTSCGGGAADEASGPSGGAVFEGSFAIEPGVGPGSISFVLDESGTRVLTALIDPALDEFACPVGRVFISGGGISATYTPGIAIESGGFDQGGLTGVFDSPASAHGTFDLQDAFDCPYKVAWTATAAEPSAAGPATSQPPAGSAPGTTSTPPAPTTAPTPTGFDELCEVNRRMVERGGAAPEDPEAFWAEELTDAALMVDLVPAHLRADMETHAASLIRLAELLSGYDYDFSEMLDDLGTEALDSIFTPEVLAADERLEQFLTATCSG